MKKNWLSSQSWVVILTNLILGCSITNFYFENNYSTCITVLIITLFAFIKTKDAHNFKKLILLCISFVFCTTIINISQNRFKDFKLGILKNTKKEYQLEITNVCEEVIDTVNYIKGDILNTKPKSDYFYNKTIFIEKNFILEKNNENLYNICVNTENIQLRPNMVWIEKAHLIKNRELNPNTLLQNFEKKLFRDQYDQSVAFGWAMLTGKKKFIHPSNIKRYKVSGTMHYFAVSGLHVGFLCLILNFILKRLIINDNLILFVTFFACLLYIYSIGLPISAIRALLMISIFYCCKNSLLKCKRITFFCISLITIIIYDHTSIFLLSAQLSFNVVLFILFSIESLSLKHREKYSILNKLRFLFIISLSASAGSSLLILDVFRTFPYLSIITNLIFAPFIFLFYIINIFHISCLLLLDSSFLTTFHNLLYNFFNYTTFIVSNLSSHLPNLLSFNLNISPLVHYFLFTSFLLSFCIRVSSKVRLSIVTIYYIFVWLSYYFLCD